MNTAASEFTQKAIERARNDNFHGRDEHSSPIEKEDKRTLNVRLSERELGYIYEALDSLETKSKSIIKRAKNFPTDTIRSSQTIEKHENIITTINSIRSEFVEASI
jgi:hypothetical protein